MTNHTVMKKFTGLLACAMLLLAATAQAKVTLWTCGDSSMCDYKTDGSTDKRGWCQFIRDYFTDDVEIINMGKSGQSTHSFMDTDAYWPYVRENVKPGDYVLVQFAHNDEKNNGMDGYEVHDYYLSTGDTQSAAEVTTRGSVPSRTYIAMLEEIATGLRRRGAYPVFATSICRVRFDGGDVSRSGRHDLGDSFSVLTPEGILTRQSLPADDHTMDYTFQMKQLAARLGVPCIDMMEATRRLYLKYGDEESCIDALCAPSDRSHPNYDAAVIIGRIGAGLLRDAGILAGYIHADTPDLFFSRQLGEFGTTLPGECVARRYRISGFALAPEAGEVRVAATEGFEVSADGIGWCPAVSLPYTDGTLVAEIHVRAMPAKSGVSTGILTAVCGETSASMELKVSAVEVGETSPAALRWPLGHGAANPAVAEAEPDVFEETSFSYGGIFTPSVRQVGGNTQTLFSPAERLREYDDANSLVFTVRPVRDLTFMPTSFSFSGSRFGTDGGLLKITVEHGGKCETLATDLKLDRVNSGEAVQESRCDFPIDGMFVGGLPVTFRICIGELAVGKQLGFRDVTVAGKVTSAAVGALTEMPDFPASYEIHDAAGRRLKEPGEGVNIISYRDKDGEFRSRKLVVRR